MADDQFVKGLDALLAELKGLPGNIEKNALRTSLLKSAQFLRDKLKETAPVSDGVPPKGGRMAKYTPGTLRKSFKAKRGRGTPGQVAAGVTGAFYAKWVEFGHTLKSHGPKSQRRVVGHVPPNPFIRTTFEANKDQALEVAKRGLVEAIQKQVDKLRSKMPRGG